MSRSPVYDRDVLDERTQARRGCERLQACGVSKPTRLLFLHHFRAERYASEHKRAEERALREFPQRRARLAERAQVCSRKVHRDPRPDLRKEGTNGRG
jgi:hypothetical protein